MGTAQYPLLTLIDRARGDGTAAFASHPDAWRLERRARALVEEYWSDTFWITGIVSAGAFRRVCDELEAAMMLPDRIGPTVTVHPWDGESPRIAEAAALQSVPIDLDWTTRPLLSPTRIATPV